MRVGLACLQQETNTFAARPTGSEDFASQGILRGGAMLDELAGTNTEIAGAAERLLEAGAEPVPLLAAWAPPAGRVEPEAFAALAGELEQRARAAAPLDGLVLSLHGAMAVTGLDDGDGEIVSRLRGLLGETAIGVCLDLHANVTERMCDAADVLVGYHTYPHVDQAATGRRVAALVVDHIARRSLGTALAKRPMLLPAETTGMQAGAMASLRALADRATTGSIRDVSLFVVQPWLDVAELGFAVTVTAENQPEAAAALAEEIADRAWQQRDAFDVALVSPARALELARDDGERPVLLVESADSTSAGAGGDGTTMIRALLSDAPDLRALVTVVDPEAVERCWSAGAGAPLRLSVGGRVDPRFAEPVTLDGVVCHLDDGRFRLSGPVSTGLAVSSGRRAVIRCGRTSVMVTERSAYTYDPAAFGSAGLDPAGADVVVVRSACMFRAGWEAISTTAHILDTPGASTPHFASLPYERAPRPLYPLDRV
jgi:microcystin degradation protein MlrC